MKVLQKYLNTVKIEDIYFNININYNQKTKYIGISINKTYYKQKPINKYCSNYLGIVIAEQVLSKVFKNVQVMPYGNKNYDFICEKGYKIDVKSACLSKNKYWSFGINKNKIPDYFLCLAFDNRINLNPLYLWLIPGLLINNKTRDSIQMSTLSKWDKYKLDINKVIKCCKIQRS